MPNDEVQSLYLLDPVYVASLQDATLFATLHALDAFLAQPVTDENAGLIFAGFDRKRVIEAELAKRFDAWADGPRRVFL